ncbi:MAG: nucleotidyltransferase domain-containing protein, partial [Selenomonadales bacterium]|nr:nucleotidyltransferase domain-containing protein [Selenomonadales bacterium]
MIQLKEWIPCFVKTVQNVFGERIYFVGLQGSYGRGEADEKSDIDIVMILDELKADDIRTYNDMLDGLSDRELICGFLAGKQELLH